MFLLSKALGGWSLLVAALIGAAFVAWQVNLPRRAAVRAASRRSSIPMLTTNPFSTATLGADAPTGVDQQTLVDRVEANQTVAAALAELPAGWYVFHSRITMHRDIVDHVVVGPPGVIAIRSERVPGHLALDVVSRTIEGAPVTIDGSPIDMDVSVVLGEVASTIDAHLLTPNRRRVTKALLVASEATIDGGVLHQPVTVDGGEDEVTWVTPAVLVEYLQQLPSVQRDGPFIDDLATVVDYQLPPAA